LAEQDRPGLTSSVIVPRIGTVGSLAGKTAQKAKGAANLRSLLLVFASIYAYCRAVVAAVQGLVSAPVEERTTASSNEQK
jgi:hypothetical protein